MTTQVVKATTVGKEKDHGMQCVDSPKVQELKYIFKDIIFIFSHLFLILKFHINRPLLKKKLIFLKEIKYEGRFWRINFRSITLVKDFISCYTVLFKHGYLYMLPLSTCIKPPPFCFVRHYYPLGAIMHNKTMAGVRMVN